LSPGRTAALPDARARIFSVIVIAAMRMWSPFVGYGPVIRARSV
jgi:hypothetical protein